MGAPKVQNNYFVITLFIFPILRYRNETINQSTKPIQKTKQRGRSTTFAIAKLEGGNMRKREL